MDNSKNASVYIIDIEAKDLANSNWEYEIKEEKRESQYSCSLPVSLDILKLKKVSPDSIYTKNESGEFQTYNGEILNNTANEKLYTDAIINVTFDRASYESPKKLKYDFKVQNDKTIVKESYKGKLDKNVRELRRTLYELGFTLKIRGEKVKYIKYKRSASKAREGSHLFIKKDLKDAMDDWYNFGVEYKNGDENVPLAAIKAYESLTSSGIEKTININPCEILLIDDITKKVEIRASVTEKTDGDIIVVDYDNYPIKNIIWDGQSLLDTSLFEYDEKGEQKGMMLLRNSFFKSCGFNTNIQKWFDDAFNGNKPEYIKDMFDRDIKLSDIKLITTPSSLKFLKFADEFNGNKQECYEKWLASISEVFGVCKSEKSSYFGEYQQLTYQIINSLPLSKDEIGKITKNPKKADNPYSYDGLLKDDLVHIEKMKNNVDYFKSKINFSVPLPADELMLKLLEVNQTMWNTDLIKNFVADKIDAYIENIKQGRIKIKDTDYAVLFGNPLEMLQYATHKKIEDTPLTGHQIYCSKYNHDVDLAGFRNPHITMGNVLFAKNVYKKEFEKYFNLTENIVISNAWDSDIMARLQGQDYDSDTLLLSSHPILVKAANDCQNDNFRVPINGIEGNSPNRIYDVSNELDIDCNSAENKIGEIVNLSQLLNSYYWEYTSKNDDGKYDVLLKIIYDKTSILSSLSQIEIDRAKKDYDTFTDNFLDDLRAYEYNGELLLKKSEETFQKDELSQKTAYEILKVTIPILQIIGFKMNEETIKRIKEYSKDLRKYNDDEIKKLKKELEFFRVKKMDKINKVEIEFLAYSKKYDNVNPKNKEYIIFCEKDDFGTEAANENLIHHYNEEIIRKIEQEVKILYDNLDMEYDLSAEQLGSLLDFLEAYSFIGNIEEIHRLNEERNKLFDKEKKVQERPKFMKYCGDGRKYSFRYFDTPMDYLHQIFEVDKIPERKKKTPVDIADIIPEPNFCNEDENAQLKEILLHCTNSSKYIKAIQSNQYMSDEKRYSMIREAHNNVIEKLKPISVNENMIRVIIYKAYSNKNIKKRDKKYRDIRRNLINWLYKAHEDKFMQVIEMSRNT